MKAKFSLVAVVLAGFILFAACGTTSSSTAARPATTTTSAGYTTGQTFGTSVLALYSQYKTSKTINFKDPTTLLQVLQLATSATVIKQNLKNTAFYADFTKGAVLGSQNNISSSNVGSILNLITGLDLNGIASAASSKNVTTTTASSVTTALTSIFGLFGK
jgi:hypothetical protein